MNFFKDLKKTIISFFTGVVVLYLMKIILQ